MSLSPSDGSSSTYEVYGEPGALDLSLITKKCQISTDESEISQLFHLLEKHRLVCQEQERYQDAQQAKDLLEKLRISEDNRRREAIACRHLAERLDVEEAHMLEFEEFNLMWDNRLKEFDQQTVQKENELKKRQEDEFNIWSEQELQKLMFRPKFSKDLLNLKNLQVSLARGKNYKEAEKIKKKVDELQQLELSILHKQSVDKLSERKKKYIEKQKLELFALHNRRLAEREKLNRQRLDTLDNHIIQKYTNLKTELERQQHMERVRTNRMLELGISLNATIRTEAPSHGFSRSPSRGASAATTTQTTATTQQQQQQSQFASGGSSLTVNPAHMKSGLYSSAVTSRSTHTQPQFSTPSSQTHTSSFTRPGHSHSHSSSLYPTHESKTASSDYDEHYGSYSSSRPQHIPTISSTLQQPQAQGGQTPYSQQYDASYQPYDASSYSYQPPYDSPTNASQTYQRAQTTYGSANTPHHPQPVLPPPATTTRTTARTANSRGQGSSKPATLKPIPARELLAHRT